MPARRSLSPVARATLAVSLAYLAMAAGVQYAQAYSLTDRCAAAGFPTVFDAQIRDAVEKHWPLAWQDVHCEWRAQLAAESSLSERTCDQANSAGARCLAQILPGTAKDIEAATGLVMTRSSAAAAIQGGAWYMKRLGAFWGEPRPEPCRRVLARASYIAGPGHIAQAQRLARAEGLIARCWEEMAAYLDDVTGPRNAADTRAYVGRIRDLSAQMEPEEP